MTKIEIYTKTQCPYCRMAVGLLESKGASYQLINLNDEPERTQEMLDRSGGRTTVPEIFINEQLIGGYDDLAELEKAGKLDALLAS